MTLLAALKTLWRPPPPGFAAALAVQLQHVADAGVPLVVGSHRGAPVGLRGCDVIVRRGDPLLWRIVEWNARGRAAPPMVLVLGEPGCAVDWALGVAGSGGTACGLDFHRVPLNVATGSQLPQDVLASMFAAAFCPEAVENGTFWATQAHITITGLFAWSAGRLPAHALAGLANGGLFEPLTAHERARLLRDGVDPVGARLLDAISASARRADAVGIARGLATLAATPEHSLRNILRVVAEALDGLTEPAAAALGALRPCLLEILDARAGGVIAAVKPDALPVSLAAPVLRFVRTWAWASRCWIGNNAALAAPLLQIEDWRPPEAGGLSERTAKLDHHLHLGGRRGCRVVVVAPDADPRDAMLPERAAVVLEAAPDGARVQLRHYPGAVLPARLRRPGSYERTNERGASKERAMPGLNGEQTVVLDPPWRCRPGSV